MYLIERNPTLSDFFGIAVKTTSRQASGLSVSQPPKTHQEQEIQPQKSRPAKSTHHFDDHTIRSRLFTHFCTCQGIEEVMKLHCKKSPSCLNLTLCQMLKANQTLQLNVHIVVIITINLAAMFNRSSSPPAFVSPDQNNQQEVCFRNLAFNSQRMSRRKLMQMLRAVSCLSVALSSARRFLCS